MDLQLLQMLRVGRRLSEVSVYPNFDLFRNMLEYLHVGTDTFCDEIDEFKSKWPTSSIREASIHVLCDRLIQKEGSTSKALLAVVSDKVKIDSEGQNQRSEPLFAKEDVVFNFVDALLQKGANIFALDDNNQISLHHAVKRSFRKVLSRLLETDDEYTRYSLRDTEAGKSPLNLALEKNDDGTAVLILHNYVDEDVPSMFVASRMKDKADTSFCQLLNNMKETMLHVLDCMIEIDEIKRTVKLDYSLLEADLEGRNRDHPKFDSTNGTIFQLISKKGNKDVKCHILMRQLIKKKWKEFAQNRFALKFAVFNLSIIFMTIAAFSGAMTSDPTRYDSPMDFARAFCEVYVLIMVLMKFGAELYQMYRDRLQYWKEKFNYIDLVSSGCVFAVVPLRLTNSSEQWIVFGVGFLIWTFRIFKYAVVTRKTGFYVQVLWQLVTQEFPQFTIVFSVILCAFSGSFILILKGENSLHIHNETSGFCEILLTGTRILIEGQPVVDYTGPDGFKPMSAIFMAAFLFVSCVVLLNILIAQLSDRYDQVQQDAKRGFIVNRIWIISRLEKSWMFKYFWKIKPVKLTETIPLDKWLRIVENGKMIYQDGRASSQRDISSVKESLASTQQEINTIKNRLISTQHEISSVKDELSKMDKRLQENQEAIMSYIRGLAPNTSPAEGTLHNDSDSVNSLFSI